MSKEILITTPNWIGGRATTQPFYRRSHELYPGCTTDAFAPKWSMTVFECMPEIDRVMESPFGHGALGLKKRWRIGYELGEEGYDQVIVLSGSLKPAIIALATDIKQRTGYVDELRYLLLNDVRRSGRATLSLMVDCYTALMHLTQTDFNGHSDSPCFVVNPESHQVALVRHGLVTGKPTLVFHPDTEYGLTKCWFARHFTELGRRYLVEGWQVWLFGPQKNLNIADEINRFSDGLCTNLCGKTDLSEVIDSLPYTDTVVRNDSGLMHLATVFDRELAAAYGSSNFDHTPPLSQKAKIASLSLDYSPCFERECSLGHMDCLNELAPDIV